MTPSEADTASVAFAAWWCGSGGATRTTAQQAARGDGICWKFAAAYGPIHQNELLRQAVLDAKKGDYFDAVAKIAACQCHNPPIVEVVYGKQRELICWLRTQKY